MNQDDIIFTIGFLPFYRNYILFLSLGFFYPLVERYLTVNLFLSPRHLSVPTNPKDLHTFTTDLFRKALSDTLSLTDDDKAYLGYFAVNTALNLLFYIVACVAIRTLTGSSFIQVLLIFLGQALLYVLLFRNRILPSSHTP